MAKGRRPAPLGDVLSAWSPNLSPVDVLHHVPPPRGSYQAQTLLECSVGQHHRRGQSRRCRSLPTIHPRLAVDIALSQGVCGP
eukprot:5398295-Alexandrium_andersonii.AAC.2